MLLDAHTNLVDKQGRSVVCPVSSCSTDFKSISESAFDPHYVTLHCHTLHTSGGM